MGVGVAGGLPRRKRKEVFQLLKYNWLGLGSVVAGDSLLWGLSENETSILL